MFTDLAVLDFHEEKRAMRVVSLHPGVTKDQVVEATGFDLIWPDEVPETPAPTGQELTWIHEIDRDGAFLNGRIF